MGTNNVNKVLGTSMHAELYQKNAMFSFDNVGYEIINSLTEKDLGLLGVSPTFPTKLTLRQ